MRANRPTSASRRKARRIAGVSLAAVAAMAAAAGYDLYRASPAPSAAILAAGGEGGTGEALFAFGDMGALDLDTLARGAVPWRLVTAALALRQAGGNPEAATEDGAREALRSAGFLYPASFGNGPGLEPAKGPLGMSVGEVRRTLVPLDVKVANLGCAACHAGVTYGRDGSPRTDVAWLGMPNTSLDLERYVASVYGALKAGLADREALMRTVDRLNPDMGLRERATLRLAILPIVSSKMADAERDGGRPLPFPNGSPGATNGVAALKNRLGVPIEASGGPGFVSIPDLGSLPFRTAMLADGAYAARGHARFDRVTRAMALGADPLPVAEVVSFFTVPSMGMTSPRAMEAIPEVARVVGFLNGYAPQPFPGPVDGALAGRGGEVYAARCASCHGTYDGGLSPRLSSFPNWHGDVGTDPARHQAFNLALSDAVGRTRHASVLDPSSTGGYVAPALTGVWATAPYFVNGSVPTLAAVLDPPSRPERFPVGGHRLDFEAVGIALQKGPDGALGYPAGYRPFSTPATFDTGRAGNSNRGHEREVEGIPPEDRRALLEYLKLL